jgi:hypothetical protein
MLQNQEKRTLQWRLSWVAILAELGINSACFAVQSSLDCTAGKAELLGGSA